MDARRTASMLLSLAHSFWRAVALVLLDGPRLLLPQKLRPGARAASGAHAFYEGAVRHTRLAPARHAFEYAARYCVLDLDAPESFPACAAGRLADDRLTAAEARALSGCAGRVLMLALPESAGYEQNPICVYYCHAPTGELERCIAEVTNTPWADRVRFAFAPGGESMPKPMHVSPLQDMRSTYFLRATAPADKLHVTVACKHPELGNFFCATLDARKVDVADDERWAWLMPHRVAVWIYWHAAVLVLRKGLTFFGHPRSAAGEAAAPFKEGVLERAAQMGFSAPPRAAAGMCPFVWRDAADYPWEA